MTEPREYKYYAVYRGNKARPWITKGKKYKVLSITEYQPSSSITFDIIDNDGLRIVCLAKACSYLNGDNWTFGLITEHTKL